MNWSDYNPRKKRNKYLIKFLSEELLFKFLESGEIWFSRADKFGDKMECVTINDLNRMTFPFEELNIKKQKHLISCWHNVDSESIAMWDSSFKKKKDKRVFALKFETNELIELIKKSNHDLSFLEKKYGNVVYKDILKDVHTVQNHKMRRSSFRKEASFSYEKEFRFVIKMNEVFNKKGLGLKIGNPKDINFQIMINPLLDKKEFIDFEVKLLANPTAREKMKHSKLVEYLKTKEW